MSRELQSLLETSTETALIPRRDPSINSALELLDHRWIEAANGPADTKLRNAWASLQDDEIEWIDEQIYKCRYDRRHYLENYHCVKTERGEATALKLWSHQEFVFERLEELWKKNGCYRIIVLKPRQVGFSTFALGLIFHATIFNPRKYTLMMAQAADTTAELYRRLWDAYNALPWWMRPEMESKVQENRFVFQRANPERRVISPGLGSTLVISNAQRQAGVAIGQSISSGLFSEMSRWPPSDLWTADIAPSMNAPDMQAIIESTAHGRYGVYYNLWEAIEKGEEPDWTAIFIPVYRVKKYFLPVRKGEGFELTEEEKVFRDRVALPMEKGGESFTIPLGFFNWQRRKIRTCINAERSNEGLYKFQESYPSTAKEAFISSGNCAFPLHCLDEQERMSCLPPIWIGEVEYTGSEHEPCRFHPPLPTPEQIKQGVVNYTPHDIATKPNKKNQTAFINRLWLWELPDPNSAIPYYIGADVSSGTARDYSSLQVIRLGYGMEPRVQVAMWHGMMQPTHFAKVVAALGYWYHTAEIAVEYQQAGITTGNELQWYLDYPNLYRWKHLDKISNTATVHTHWITTYKNREDAINRVNEGLLDHTLVIRNKVLIDEMRNFSRFENVDKPEGFGDSDDATMALVVTLGASSQAGKEIEAPTHRTAISVPKVWGIYDHFMRQIEQVDSEEKARKIINSAKEQYDGTVEEVLAPRMGAADHTPVLVGWKVMKDGMLITMAREMMVMEANTPYSPIHDSSRAEHQLVYKHGIPERKVTPEIVQIYREILTTQHYMGGDD